MSEADAFVNGFSLDMMIAFEVMGKQF